MAGFAQMSTLDVWYAHLSAKTAIKTMRAAQTPDGASSKERKALKQREKVAKTVVKKARQRDSIQALSKLAEQVDGRYRIVSQPPFIVPLRDIAEIYPTLPQDMGAGHQQAAHVVRPDPAARPPSAARALRARRRGAQGGRRRERRDPSLHRAVRGQGRAGPPVPPAQGGDHLGPREPPAQEPLPAPRPAGRARPATHAGDQRHLPRLDLGRGRHAELLLAGSCAT